MFKEESTMIELMLHEKEYKQKPTKRETAVEINSTIMQSHRKISVEDLASEIAKGKTFCPAYLGGRLDLNEYGKPRRTIHNWSSQQVICLDFDNEKDKKVNISLTLEDAIAEFKDSAAFIYKSFNYKESHPKFRVVFVLKDKVNDYDIFSAIIEGILERYPYADQQCKDGSRLFYGGTEVIELNFENRLTWTVTENESLKTVEIKGEIEGEGGFCVPVRSKVFKSSSNRDKKTPSITQSANNINSLSVISVNNIRMIQEMKISELQDIIKPTEVRFYTYDEVYEYLKKQDLNKLLGLYGSSFKCVFHDDHESSANIYINSETGHYMYKCFSDNCKFKHGTIMKCIERILGCNKVEGLRFLRRLYKIDYHETAWQKEQREILDANIRYIRSKDFQTEYPVQYKLIKPYLDDLHTFLILAKDNLPPEHYSEEQKMPIFYATLNQFANLRGYKDHRRLTDRLALFAYLCYIYKLSEEQTPDKILKQAKRELVKSKGERSVMNVTSFFSIPSYSENVMSAAEDYAEKYFNNHLTMSNWGWEMLYRTFGKEEADRVYPQLTRKKISEISHEHESRIEKTIFESIERCGYALEDNVVNTVQFEFGGSDYKKKQLKICIGEIISKYGLTRIRLNKKLKEKYKISGNGYPYIIVRDE